MLKILHVITGLRRGGAEATLNRLVAATREQFDHVVVSLSGDDSYGPILRANGATVATLNIGTGRSAPAAMLALIRRIRSERPDVIQTWMYHADVFGGIAARMAGRRPIIWGVRNANLGATAIGRSARLAASIGAFLSRFVPDAITCNSHEAQRVHIAFGYHAPSFRIIENGYDVQRFQPDAGLRAAVREEFSVAPHEILIGHVARWDPQKDHANLLAALGHVARQGSRFRVLLVGTNVDAANERLAELMRATGFGKEVMLAGARDDIPAIMNALDLHVLSSLGEASPNVVAEAMSCGTPCVVTDVGDAARIVGDTGWVAPARDSAALAVAIRQGLGEIERRGRDALGRACRARIVDHFHLRRMTQAYTFLWRDLASRAVQGGR